MKSEERWMKCISNYRFHSIYFKNLLLIMGVVVLPFISIVFLSAFYSYSIQKSERKAYSDETVARITTQVENILEEAKMNAIMLSANEDINLFCYQDGDKLKLSTIQNIYKYISIYNSAVDIIDSVCVYSKRSNLVMTAGGLSSYDNFIDKKSIDLIQDTDELYHFRYQEKNSGEYAKETLSLYYRYLYQSKYECIIMIHLDMEKLRERLSYRDDVSVKIVRGEEILYVDEKETEMLVEEECFTVTKELENHMQLVIRINLSDGNEKFMRITRLLVLFISGIVAVTFIMIFYISKKIYNPIGEILEVLEREELSDKENTGEKEGLFQKRDELKVIMDAFYSSISDKRNMKQELEQRLVLLRKAQAVALQSQINPHFMNNTLETVNWMAIERLGKENEISRIVSGLSKILRGSLESTDTFITLEEEIEYAKTYLLIQSERYDQCFQVVWNVPTELLECRIIKMVLQPILENAIRYGIEPYADGGRIDILAERTENVISLTVKDTGLGVTLEEVIKINQSIQKNIIKENKHIGLSNVNQRIVLAFGEEYGVHFFSELYKGTTVIVTFPSEG